MLSHLPYQDKLTILFCLVDDPSLRSRAGSFAYAQGKLFWPYCHSRGLLYHQASALVGITPT